MSSNRDPRRVSRRRAKSGRVDYAEPLVIYRSRNRQLKLVPFFIPHDHGPDALSIKLIPGRAAMPNMYTDDDEHAITLNEEATSRLLEWLLGYQAVAEEAHVGEYLVLPLTAEASALAQILTQPALLERMGEPEVVRNLDTALLDAFKLGDMRSAVADLRRLLEGGVVDEAPYQRWCEEHAWAFGNAYQIPDEVRNITISDQVDLLLPLVMSGFRDVIELKRPDVPVLGYDSSHRNHYFSREASLAIGQCDRYLNMLQEAAKEGLLDRPEVVAYHPRATIVIGRSEAQNESWVRALHGLNSRMVGISIMTYDQLLAQGERLLGILSDDQTTSR